jgi:hypothetical protein
MNIFFIQVINNNISKSSICRFLKKNNNNIFLNNYNIINEEITIFSNNIDIILVFITIL